MTLAPTATYFDIGDNSILGRFVEKDYGHLFEFSANPEKTLYPKPTGGKNIEYPHIVWVNSRNPEPRFAKVLKTVAYIVTDVREDGSARIEKWDICDRCVYTR